VVDMTDSLPWTSTGPLAFGVATASYQVEGATTADGRGVSIWDTFTAQPGTIADGSDGSVACGSYDRIEEDLDLVAGLGVEVYRFSVAWPRIQPSGSGAVESRGLDYYDRLVDGLRSRGVRPLPTLYHWDLPQALEDAGGWPARDTAYRFADYAEVVRDRIGDRVDAWATLNEPWCSAFLGYAAGIHAPGRQEPASAYAAAHHLLLGHGLAAERLRGAGRPGTVGIVLNLAPVWPEDDSSAAAAAAVDAVQNRIWLGALIDGRYDDDLLTMAPALADVELVQDGDLDTVKGSLDWMGVNYYTPYRVAAGDQESIASGQRAAAFPGAPALTFLPREPRTAMGWEIEPSGLEELLVDVSRRAAGIPLMVTENGAAFDDDKRNADDAVDDQDRLDYIRDHVDAVRRARDKGADVRVYIAWTLLDNFEWAEGYRKKFGIVEVESGSLRRVPKASYHWYASVAGNREVADV
jgi:beta-glucosidase